MATTSEATSQQEVILPLVAVPGGVVFPGTVVTLTLDSDDARAAIDAAHAGDGRVLLVPYRDGTYASVGVIAKVESVGELPVGGRAAILRGVRRGRLGAAVPGERSGLWVHVTPSDEPQGLSQSTEAANRELRAVLQNVAELRGSRRLPELLRTISDPGALADAVTAWSEVALEQQIDVLETIHVGDRVELVLDWAKDHLAELQVARQIRDGVAEGVEKQQREFLLRQQLQAIRKELGEGDDETGRQLPRPARRADAAGEGARGGREGAGPARAHQRPEPRAGLDPDVAGPRPRPAVGHHDRGSLRPRPRRAPSSTPTTRASTT